MDGIAAGAQEYRLWSLGNSISDYGTEAAMNVFIARSIYECFADEGVAVALEEDFSRLSCFSSVATPPDLKGCRVDVAVYKSADKTRLGAKPIAVVETKRSALNGLATDDIMRIARAIDICKLRVGYFGAIELPYPSGKETIEKLMRERTRRFSQFAQGQIIEPFWRWDDSRLFDFAPPLGRRLIVPLLFEMHSRS